MTTNGNQELKIPQQDLRGLSFANTTAKAIKAWYDHLPMVNVGETARQLYNALQEVNRLQTDPLQRFEILEQMRPGVRYVCTQLEKHYLNKAVVLPVKAAKVANLSQALQSHLATGYKIVTATGLPKLKDNSTKRVVSISIHRAMSALGQCLLRCMQLYYPTPGGVWKEINALYQIAEHHRLLHTEVPDEEINSSQPTTLLSAYLCPMLLTAAKPNQLRQRQIAATHHFAQRWGHYAQLTTEANDETLFAIKLESDIGPTYVRMLSDSAPGSVRYLDVSDLATDIQDYLSDPDNSSFDDPGNTDINTNLLQHLMHSWGVLTERAFTRTPAAGELDVVLGLSATHFYTAGRTPFDILMHGGNAAALSDEPNLFLKGKKEKVDPNDPWAHGFDSGPVIIPGNAGARDISAEVIEYSQKRDKSPDTEQHPIHRVRIVNTSPGGYCLSWGTKTPEHVKTGELIGVKEKGQNIWNIGVIRWVKQFKNEGVRVGAELLAPRAEPCGARARQAKNDVPYLRAMLLPELNAIGQAATIIAPNVSFKVGLNILIKKANGDMLKAQLGKPVTITPSFSQFQFKVIGGTKTTTESEQTLSSQEDDFDSIWSSL